jgi:hypothetical protein
VVARVHYIPHTGTEITRVCCVLGMDNMASSEMAPNIDATTNILYFLVLSYKLLAIIISSTTTSSSRK